MTRILRNVGLSAGVALALALLPVAPAYARDLCTANRLGLSGAWQVPSAALCHDRLLSVALSGAFTELSGLTASDDTYTQWMTGLHIVWTITPAWQMGLGGGGTHATLDLPGRSQARSAGDTELYVKYTTAVWDKLEIAPMLHIATPSAAATGEASGAYQTGLFAAVPSASTVTPQLSLTWRPAALAATLNLGYALDYSRNLIAGRPTAEQAAGMHITAGNRVMVQAAVLKAFATPLPWLAAVPFMELGAALPGEKAVSDSAATLTLGGKALFGVSRFVEATLGIDIGLAGLAPTPTDIPTTPGWKVFLQAAIHIERLSDTHACPKCAPSPPAAPAPAGRAVAPGRPLQGIVVDANTGAAVSDARVHVTGLDTVLATDPHTGAFTTWPLDTRQEAFVWTAYAPGYLAASTSINPRTWPRGATVRIAMTPNQGAAPLNLRGIVRDDRTGEPVMAKIFVPQNGVVIACGADGGFVTSLKPGRWEVIVSAPNHTTQKRMIAGGEGDTVILNVDLHYEKPRRAPTAAPQPDIEDDQAPEPPEAP